MTKIDIVSGFLGAGKTTLIKKLLAEAYKGEKLVLIENEFGEINIDGGFLKESGIQISEMSSGCICCSLVGDFGKALKDVQKQFHPDRILIEPSGVGKLSDVVVAVQNTIAEIPDMVLDSYVTVADATKVKVYMKNFGEFYNNQIESAGAIILSRTQKLTQEKLEAAAAMLREKNPDAAILTTPWDQLDGKVILSAMEKVSLADEMLEKMRAEHEADEHEHHHDHDEDDDHDEHEHHHHHHDGEECDDPNCPFHGTLPVRGQIIDGVVSTVKMNKTVVVERQYMKYTHKYERYEKRSNRYSAHCPSCLGIKPGDRVRIAECRPISKTVAFVVIEKVE